jgi:aminoacylase
MKCVCMQYIEAVWRLIRAGERLKRTVHLTFVPDEEIGGGDGMGKLVDSPEWAALNVGVGLDEGLASTRPDTFSVFYGERAVWWLKVRSVGPTGHASRFIQNTAMERLLACVQRFLAFRKEQEEKLHAGCDPVTHKLGDVATVNLTMLQGGVTADNGKTFALNVIPTECWAGFDVRLPPSLPLKEFEAKLREWTCDADPALSYEFVFKTPEHSVTSIDREKNRYWAAFEDALTISYAKASGRPMKLEVEVFPAATDGRYVRGKNIPVFGFSPIFGQPILLHEHNERLHAGVYLLGIDVYTHVLRALGNLD